MLRYAATSSSFESAARGGGDDDSLAGFFFALDLLETEGVRLRFDEGGVRRIAEVAFDVNQRTENIGARRLHTVMERLLETISYEASDRSGTTGRRTSTAAAPQGSRRRGRAARPYR